MNKATLMGNVSTDVNITIAKDVPIAKFSIAINEKKGGKDIVNFIPLVAFGKTAEFAAQHVEKGDPILVDGSINTFSYDKDGVKKYGWQVIVNNLTYLKWVVKRNKSDNSADDDEE